jgi:predicted ester cyclase
MTTIVERAMRLWREPVPTDDAAALAAFGGVYADPVVVNGVPTPLADLVARARMMQTAFGTLSADVQEVVEGDGHVAFAFRLSGRHVGPFSTPLGTAAPTDRPFTVQAMDVFVVRDDRVERIWAVADQLDLLAQVGAVALSGG